MNQIIIYLKVLIGKTIAYNYTLYVYEPMHAVKVLIWYV